MYSIAVEATFSASHQVRLPDGTRESLHAHDWVVRAWFSCPTLDGCDMVVDFHEAQVALRAVVSDFQHKNLNEIGAIAALNPTAEVLARHIYDRIRVAGLSGILRVEVTEAPGCVAAYECPRMPISTE